MHKTGLLQADHKVNLRYKSDFVKGKPLNKCNLCVDLCKRCRAHPRNTVDRTNEIKYYPNFIIYLSYNLSIISLLITLAPKIPLILQDIFCF